MTTTEASPRSPTMAAAVATATLLVLAADVGVRLRTGAVPLGGASGLPPSLPWLGLLALALLAALMALAGRMRTGPSESPAPPSVREALPRAWTLGLVVVLLCALLADWLGPPNLWRGSEFYVAAALALPFPLLRAHRGRGHPWGATLVALSATLVQVAALGLAAALAGAGGAGPTPLRLPLLLVVPALGLDLALRGLGPVGPRPAGLLRAAVLGLVFVLAMLAAHWGAAGLLLPTSAVPGAPIPGWEGQLWNLDAGTRDFAAGMLLAWAIASAAGALASAGRAQNPRAAYSVGRRTFL